jgi:hypothetical protein
MKSFRVPVLLLGLATLAGCSKGVEIEVANNDSAALVRAIRLANETPGHHTIRLARNGLYILGGEAEAGLLLPNIRGELSIEGNYAEIRGYSAHPAAILHIEDGARVELQNLVVAEGTDGAIRNYGNLKLENVSIVDSSVRTLPAIVLNHGYIEASDTEIAYNLLLSNRRDAGTVLNYGEMDLESSSIHGNRTIGRDRAVAAAGGVLNFGRITANGLLLEDNELPGDDIPSLSFGGILNLGNGHFSGTTSAGAVRDARQAGVLAGL